MRAASRVATDCMAAVGALGTLAAMSYAGGSVRALLSGFAIWALVPYAAFSTAV